MSDASESTSRRRLAAVAAVGIVVVGAVVGTTFAIRAREPQRSVSTVCADLEQAKDLDRALTSLDPETLEVRLGALRAAVRTAPADIEPQIAALAGFVSDIVEEVDRAPDSERRSALADAISARSSEIDAITAAGDAVETWTAENCGLDLGGATTPDAP